jgi:hypothetical protein
MDKEMEKMQLRQNYRNLWHSDLLGTIQADTPCKDSLLRKSFEIYAEISCVCVCFFFFLSFILLFGCGENVRKEKKTGYFEF